MALGYSLVQDAEIWWRTRFAGNIGNITGYPSWIALPPATKAMIEQLVKSAWMGPSSPLAPPYFFFASIADQLLTVTPVNIIQYMLGRPDLYIGDMAGQDILCVSRRDREGNSDESCRKTWHVFLEVLSERYRAFLPFTSEPGLPHTTITAGGTLQPIAHDSRDSQIYAYPYHPTQPTAQGPTWPTFIPEAPVRITPYTTLRETPLPPGYTIGPSGELLAPSGLPASAEERAAIEAAASSTSPWFLIAGVLLLLALK